MFKVLPAIIIVAFLVAVGGCRAQTPVAAPEHPALRHIHQLTDSGHYYENRGNKTVALHYHKKALAAAQQARLPEQQAWALAHIGRVLSKEPSNESLQYLFDALTIARSIRHHALQADIYSSIAAVYKQQENYKEALEALELHNRFTDSLLEKNRLREMARAKAIENRKRERQITYTILLAVLCIVIVLAIYFRRTRTLNRQLQQSIAVRDQLFSILAHDLRGPAGNLVQVLTMMEEDPFSEEERKQVLSMLKKQGQSVSDTLESLLEWSKAQLNGVKAHPVDFSPATLADKNLALLEGQLHQKEIIVAKDIAQDLIVHADADHIDLVMRNLLSNAIKFSHRGGVITLSAQPSKDNKILFTVKDQGIGLSPENQEKFARQNMDITYGTSGEKGTGLGLQLVKDFIKANQGRIWLESEQGKGASFYFTLPAATT